MSTWLAALGLGGHNPNLRTCWNYTFELTPEHPDAETFEALKFSCDTLADEALARLNEIAPPPVRRRTSGGKGQLDEKDGAPLGGLDEAAGATATTTSVAGADAAAAAPTAATPLASTGSPILPDLYANAVSGEEDTSTLPRIFQPESARSSDSHPGDRAPSPSRSAAPKRDLYALLEQHAATDPKLGALWEQLTTVPAWVDWAQIARGQDVFYRYGGPCLTGLAFQSLIGGLGATRVVETLARTGGFATAVVRHRLYETTQHVLQVTGSAAALRRGGAGFVATVRVRLLHAAVRSRIRALAARDARYFDVAAWGLPISDLDAAATIGTFSATLLWLALPRQGIVPSAQEAADYMALWRYVGYLVGAPDAPLADAATARRFMESLLLREIAPSATGRALAANTLAGLAYAPPQRASPEFFHALTHWLNGRQLADALGVPRPPWYYSLLVAGQCAGFMLVCYSHRAIPYLDRRKVAALRRVFWNVIVAGKAGLGEEAVFEFKYIPQLGKTTPRSPREKPGARHAGLWATEAGVEWRSLVNLLVVVVLLAGLVYAALGLWTATHVLAAEGRRW